MRSNTNQAERGRSMLNVFCFYLVRGPQRAKFAGVKRLRNIGCKHHAQAQCHGQLLRKTSGF